MTPSRCTLALLVFALTACNPACTAPAAEGPESGTPSDKSAPERDPGVTKSPDKANTPPPSGDMISEAKGVDLTGLDENKKTSFFQILNSEASACGKAESLAKSLRDDATCRDSLSVAQFIADALKAGHAPGDIKDAMEIVVDALRVREIDIKDSPVWGNPRAPVTVVVFADFECPHCRAEAPKLRAAVDSFRGRAKLVFKHFPLSGHPRAKQAAVACEAAKEQGKFWQMHDIVFENQTALEDDDIRRYASEIGLDMAKFMTSYERKAGLAKVEHDRVDGEKLEITGTPAVFVNGRYFNDLLFGGTVTGWIDDALRR